MEASSSVAAVDHGLPTVATTESSSPSADAWLLADHDGQGNFKVVQQNQKSSKSAGKPLNDKSFNASSNLVSLPNTVATANTTRNNTTTNNSSVGPATSVAVSPFTNGSVTDIPVRFKVSLSLRTTANHAVTTIGRFLKTLLVADSALLIVDNNGELITTDSIPTTKAALQHRLSFFINSPPSGSDTAEAICILRTSRRLRDIVNDNKTSAFLRNKPLQLSSNPLGHARIARLGFCRDKCPLSTSRIDLRDHTVGLIQKHISSADKQEYFNRMKSHNILLSALNKPFFFGSGTHRVETQAIELACPLPVVDIMRRTLIRLQTSGVLTRYTFVPSSLGRSNPQDYERQFLLHNKALSEIVPLPVYNLYPEALAAPVTVSGRKTTVEEFLLSHDDVLFSIERTNKSATEGKYFIITSLATVEPAQYVLDQIFAMFKKDPPPSLHNLYPSGTGPRRKALPPSFPPPRAYPSSLTDPPPSTTTTTDSAPDTPMQQYASWLAAATSAPKLDVADPSDTAHHRPPQKFRPQQSSRRQRNNSSSSTAATINAAIPTPIAPLLTSTAAVAPPSTTNDKTSPLAVSVATSSPSSSSPASQNTVSLDAASVTQLINDILDARFSAFEARLLQHLGSTPSAALASLRGSLSSELDSVLLPSSSHAISTVAPTSPNNIATTAIDPSRHGTAASTASAAFDTPFCTSDEETVVFDTASSSYSPKTLTAVASSVAPSPVEPSTDDCSVTSHLSQVSARSAPMELTSVTRRPTRPRHIPPAKPLPPDVAFRARLNTRQGRLRKQKDLKNEARKRFAAKARAPPS